MSKKLCKNCGVNEAYTKFCSYYCYDEYHYRPEVIICRFWKHVVRGGPDECWPYDPHANYEGYRNFVYHYRDRRIQKGAHIFAYMLAHGKVPKGMFVCHMCDNPPCVNVGHLFLGTSQDNVRDMFNKGRHPIYCGEDQGNSKFTNEIVLRCRQMRRDGYSCREIGRQVGMSHQNVSDICTYQIWKHLP